MTGGCVARCCQFCFWVTSLRPVVPSALVQVMALIEAFLGPLGSALSCALTAKITLPSARTNADGTPGRIDVTQKNFTGLEMQG